MSTRLAKCSVLLLLVFARVPAALSQSQLKGLYDGKQYFELRDALQNITGDHSTDLLFYRGVVSNKFNQTEASISYLRSYLKRVEGSKNAALIRDSYEILADNYLKICQYRKAAEAYTTILTRFREGLDPKRVADHENAVRLWGALRKLPRQTATFKGDSKIQSFKDQLELTNFPVEVNGQKVSFVFDTGANISSITTSFAGKLGIKIIDASIEVGGITGNKVKTRLGTAPEMKIGNVIVRNVAFLIFDDQDLYITPARFQLNAVIGFPVIAALREITIGRNGEVVIPAKPSKRSARNMCLDGLTPLIVGTFKGKLLTFSFDTGANKTDLYPPFFKAYEEEIKTKYPSRIERIAGVGESREIIAYRVKDLVMNFAGKDATFAELPVLTETTLEKSRYFYGNLGQDLIRQFERVTISFETMSVFFE